MVLLKNNLLINKNSNNSSNSVRITLTGTTGDDILVGTIDDDTIDGGDGNDSLDGGSGNDRLNGGNGNDTIDGGAGNDSAYYASNTNSVDVNLLTGIATGVDGTDQLFNIENIEGSQYADLLIGDSGPNWIPGNSGDDTITGNDGDDSLYGGDGNDSIVGGNGNDSLDGGNGNESINGGDGNDAINGGIDDDIIDGGNGVDYIIYQGASAGVTVNLLTGQTSGADGIDTLTNIENIQGSNYDDTLTGDSGQNAIYGYDGNDTIDGGTGDEALDGGNGIDTASYLNATASVTVNLATGSASGADGTDTLTGIENIWGSNFADSLTGGSDSNYIYGYDGTDSINGGDGDDHLTGGIGNDTMDGGAGSDTVCYYPASGSILVDLLTGIATGSDGTDQLINIENIHGGQYNDSLIGNSSSNTIIGNDGDDIINGGTGNDILDGGSSVGTGDVGTDTASYTTATGSVTVNLTTGTATGADGADTLANIENIFGSNYDDTLTGNSGQNAIYGYSGNDTLIGGTGNDTLDGGNGTDTVSYTTATGSVTVNLFTGIATGADDADILTNIENILGSSYSDILTGNSSANLIYGFNSTDSIIGGDGNDTLNGGAGNDTLDGGIGTDMASYSNATASVQVNLLMGAAIGADGTDSLISIEDIYGSNYNDVLTGDSNSNSISGLDGNDSIQGGNGNNTIDGGSGTDSAIYDGVRANYTIQKNTTDFTITSANGTDSVVNIEYLQFSDQIVKIDDATDSVAPVVNQFTPVDGATGVATTDNIVLSFSEAIQRGTGNITLKTASGTVVETFNAATSSVITISGSTLTLNPTVDLSGGVNYYVNFDAGVVKDAANNNYTGTTTYDFTTIKLDATAPIVNQFAPADGAVGVAITSDIVLSFSEAIQRGTGNITLKTASGTIVETFNAATSSAITISGSTLTLNPIANLNLGVKYYVNFDSGAVKDLAENSYIGTTSYDFTTASSLDVVAPTVNQFIPADGAVSIPTTSNILVSFSEPIQKGTGKITLKTASGTIVETFNIATSSAVAITGGNMLAINPTADLSAGANYYVNLDNGVVKDLSGNSYAGTTIYDFTTASLPDITPPLVNQFIPADGAVGTGVASNIILSFSEAIQKGTGNITLKTASGTVVETFNIATSSAVAITGGSILAINPAADLSAGVNYYVNFDAGVIQDLTGNSYAGTATYDFTTALSSAPGKVITGTPKADTLTGTPGNDAFNGDAGVDTVVYSGKYTSYTLVKTPNLPSDWTVASVAEGIDTLLNVERLQFSDKNIALDITGNGGMIYRIYQAAFNRAPDKVGLGYWMYHMDKVNGFTLTEVARGFIKSQEFTNLYGDSPSNDILITKFYHNVLHREPEKAGYDYWINQLNTGTMTPDQVLAIGFSEGIENQKNVAKIIGSGFDYTIWSGGDLIKPY